LFEIGLDLFSDQSVEVADPVAPVSPSPDAAARRPYQETSMDAPAADAAARRPYQETSMDVPAADVAAPKAFASKARRPYQEMSPDVAARRPYQSADPADAGRRPSQLCDFGDYELLEVIGRGGQGVVYRARQRSLNRMVALKVIGLGHWATEGHLKRFRREAEAAASLEHSGIVPIYEVGERDGSCFFSMKLVEGGQLDEVIGLAPANSSGGGPIGVRDAAELMAKVARIVHFAHEHGVLHRDIKPGNILLDQKREPHLTDFGLARLIQTESTVTRTMEVLGTPSYMAPEQAVGNNEIVSPATDVYGLGAVLYHLLTGHPPFAGGTTYETIKLLLDTEPRAPRLWNAKIDRDLSTICLKCLDKSPERRYSSALALAEDLERWSKHEPILARRTGIIARGGKWLRRSPTKALLVASLVALAGTASWIIIKSDSAEHHLVTDVAVLPFENLSDPKDQGVLADGIQDDILTKLSKIGDLKVISRSSVMHYRGKQDARQIGNELGVSHVLEGTVRRAGDKVHVNAQLVDTRIDAGIWAEEYDRDLNDVFAIETEVAQSIASRLRAKVSAREALAIQERPTNDLVAYDDYIRAVGLCEEGAYLGDPRGGDYYSRAVELLNHAIARDPNFLLAYCRLADAHDEIYFQRADRTPSRLALAKSAIDTAFRLQPDAGEAHLALGLHLYLGYFDYSRAQAELAVAARMLPNNARIFELIGHIDRRQGRWEDARHNLERAMELDPRNINFVDSVAVTASLMRDCAGERAAVDRLIALQPNNDYLRNWRPWIDIEERADTQVLDTIKRTSKSPSLNVAFYKGDGVEAEQALKLMPAEAFGNTGFDPREIGGVRFKRSVLEGIVARMKGDRAGAERAFTAARAEQEIAVREQPDFGPTLCVLGLIDAGLGRKKEALEEGRRATELAYRANDSLDIADVVYFYAVICTWAGERDLAIEQLRASAKMPAGIVYGDIRLVFYWEPLRGDPRFEEIAASLAPKNAL
jgi:serine/threonine protein kinase/tetratricopeptide (TPR) repeat protein